MTASRFYLCVIPASFWKPESPVKLASFVADALNCERRIAKEVNLQDEYTRYTLICRQIEEEVMKSGRIQWVKDHDEFLNAIQSERFPSVIYPDGYLSLLSRLSDEPAEGNRLGRSFFPPDQVKGQRQAFLSWAKSHDLGETQIVKLRSSFLEYAQKAKCGVVEIQTSFLPSKIKESLLTIYKGSRQKDEDSSSLIEIPEFEASEVDRELFGEKGKKQHLLKILISQIEDALKTNEPVSFGNQAPHDVITEALNRFVFVEEAYRLTPAKLRVAYSDGSEAEPFPVLCLRRSSERKETNNQRPLKMALMSMRHFELDPEIDFCWFRNREVSKTRTLAETDQFCYAATIDQIDQGMEQGELHVQMYHTGFEPAVIGFYRGVVHKLLKLRSEQKQTLSILPLYFRGGNNYQPGKPWE